MASDTTPEGDFGTDDEATWSANETLKVNAIDDVTQLPFPQPVDAYKFFIAKKANSFAEALRKATRFFAGVDPFGSASTWLRLRGGIALGDTSGSGPRLIVVAAPPEGVTTAPVGSTAFDATNGKLYFKQSGAGNTGWAEVSVGATATKEKWSTYHNFNQTSTLENFIPINDLAEATGDDYYHRMLTREVACKILRVRVWATDASSGDTVIKAYSYDKPDNSATPTLLKTSPTVDINANTGSFLFDFSGDPPLYAANSLGGISIDTTAFGPDQTCARIDWEEQ